MPESNSKEPFKFSEIHVANNIKELIVLCQNDEEKAMHYLDNGDFENWLDYLGEFKLRDEVKIIRKSNVDGEEKLKIFIEKCKKIDFLKWRTSFFDFGKKNFWDIFGITIATSVLSLGFFFAQSQIQNQITKSDKEKAAIADQTSKEVEKDKYQQKALDDYIISITELLKVKDKNTFTTVARAKTLTTLYLLYLDKERRSLLLSFLRDANLLSLNDRKVYYNIVSLLGRVQDKLLKINDTKKKGIIKSINEIINDIKDKVIKVNYDEVNPDDLDIDNEELKKKLENVQEMSEDLLKNSTTNDKTIIKKIKNNLKEALDLATKLLSPKENTIALLEGIELDSINLAKVNLRDVLLKRANLTGADLRESNLSGADMEGAALNSAILKGTFLSRTNLKNIKITKSDLRGADLTSAILRGADLKYSDLREAKLMGARLVTQDNNTKNLADLSRSDLRGAWFTTWDNNCPNPTGIKDSRGNDQKISCPNDLQHYPDSPARDSNNPSLKDAIYDDNTIFPKSFIPKKKGMIKISERCDHKKNEIGCSKKSKSLKETDLQNADLSNTDLSNADLSNTDLTGAILSNTNLRGTDFTGAKLTNAIFDKAIYNDETIWKWKGEKPNLEKAIKIYPGVNLQGKDLRELNLRGFDLRGANLSKALLKSADLREANLSDTDLSGANLQYARIDDNTFDSAHFCGTILPNGNVSNKNCGTAKPRVLHVTLWISDRWQSLVDWFYETF